MVDVCTQADEPTAMEVERAGDILQLVCHKASYGAGWWKDRASDLDLKAMVRGQLPGPTYGRMGKALVAEKLMLIVSEVAEAMGGHRKGLRDDKLPDRSMLEVELADAVIRICDLAGALGLDLGGAIAAKLAYNLTRPDHKPEARAAAGGKAY
jgi:NTP pyrophosphatase (non-canonical NTP hydrolase)